MMKKIGGLLLLSLIVVAVFWRYAICAWVVGADEYLVLTRKYGESKASGQILAEDGERGVLAKVLSTGRHFINPVMYDIERHKATVIAPHQIGIVTSKAGNPPEGGSWLAERGQRGVWREVLGPGVYKLNPVAYRIEVVDQTYVPPGYVGVLVNNLKGRVEPRPLPAGLHRINTRLFKVVKVDVGVKHLGYSKHARVRIKTKMLLAEDESAEVLRSNARLGGAIGFPSRDGFNVGLDVSIVYEVKPSHAIQLIDEFGTADVLTERNIDPTLRSVTRLQGSSVTAKEIIQGETRIAFQENFTKGFLGALKNKPVEAIDALPRALYVPLKIQLPIMKKTIKEEQKLTNKEIELTTIEKDQEEQQRKKVDQEIEQVKSKTEYIVADVRSEALKDVATYKAETLRMVADVQLKVERVISKSHLISSKGEAEIVTYAGRRKAELIELRAQALGSKDNLVLLSFVESLPKEIPMRIIHAGEGTLWTDLDRMSRGGKALLGSVRRAAGARAAPRK